MVGVIGIFCQELHQAELCAVLGTFLFVFGVLAECQLCVTLQVGQSGIALEGFQFFFSGSQLSVDDFDTLVDELGSLAGHFILVVVGIAVIDFYQLVDEVHSALGAGVLQRDLGNRRGFGGRFHRKGIRIFVCYDAWGCHGDGDGLFLFNGCRIAGSEAECTVGGGEQGRELFKLLCEFLFVYFCVDTQFASGFHCHFDGCYTAGQFFRLLGSEPHFYRRVLVEFYRTEVLTGSVVDIQVQFLHHFLQ